MNRDRTTPPRTSPGRRTPQPSTKPAAGETGLLYGDIYLEHRTPAGFPERPQRLSAIMDRLRETGLLSQLVALSPRDAPVEALMEVHDAGYLTEVKDACARGGGFFLGDSDVPISPRSYDAAVAAAGGVLAAVDAVMDGTVRNAFCAVRPPGHHAMRDRAMGFCLINNVAVAARHIQKRHELSKVLIVDWDVHHGNGTQAAFYRDPTVLYFSVHRWPHYPGSGAATETGTGAGEGFTINVPLPAGASDADYAEAFQKKLTPAALAFRPDFVLISAGFDAHIDDPLGGMRLTAQGFADLTQIVKAVAEECCRGRLVSVLEGGYGLRALADSVEAHLRALIE
jgi:acetoin utilization deacetylase AcuC-like enzyme